MLELKLAEYPSDRWCELIAFMINCDILLDNPERANKTGDDIWNSNSRGELVFVAECVNVAQFLIDSKLLKFFGKRKNNLHKIALEILSGKSCAPDPLLASGMGLVFMTKLRRMSAEFENFTFDLIETHYGVEFAEKMCN